MSDIKYYVIIHIFKENGRNIYFCMKPQNVIYDDPEMIEIGDIKVFNENNLMLYNSIQEVWEHAQFMPINFIEEKKIKILIYAFTNYENVIVFPKDKLVKSYTMTLNIEIKEKNYVQ